MVNRAAGSEISISLDGKNFLTPITGLTASISSTSPYVHMSNGTIAVGSLAMLETKSALDQ